MIQTKETYIVGDQEVTISRDCFMAKARFKLGLKGRREFVERQKEKLYREGEQCQRWRWVRMRTVTIQSWEKHPLVFFSIPPSHQGRGGTERELYNLLNFALFRNLKLFVLPISSLIPLQSEKILSRSLLYGQHIFW